MILLDCSPAKITQYSERYEYQFGQLRTPLTSYRWCERPYGIDNGCFVKFDRASWCRLLQQARVCATKPLFTAIPDVVGSARRTMELFRVLFDDACGLSPCLVLQDGMEDMDIPWKDIAAIFIGGTDAFKNSEAARACCKAAQVLGKWVHVGRVNTPGRVKAFAGLAHSVDGSGMSRFDERLENVLREIKSMPADQRVDIRGLRVAEARGLRWGDDSVRGAGLAAAGQKTLFDNLSDLVADSDEAAGRGEGER